MVNWLRRDTRRALARFANLTPLAIVGLYWRAATLGWRHIPPQTPEPRPERVVVTLSTIPSRADRLRPVLNSLLDQSVSADRICLALPAFSAREKRPYPDRSALGLPAGIDLLPADDQGPATKLLPARAAETDAVLIVVDDDVVLPPRFIETLLAAHRAQPEAALGFRGVRLDAARAYVDNAHILASAIAAPEPVDVLFGTWGYLLPPGVLVDVATDAATGLNVMRWVDDIWVSGQLARSGVPRLVVPARAFPIETFNAARAALSGGPNRDGENDRRAVAAFADDW